MILPVETGAGANKALEYFNFFHDGFIKRILLISCNEYRSDMSQLLTGMFEVEIDFAHFNYAQGMRRFDQVITANFHGVRDICLDFRPFGLDPSIRSFSVVSTSRTWQSAVEPCFAAILTGNTLEGEESGWTTVEVQLFTFQTARFVEHEP